MITKKELKELKDLMQDDMMLHANTMFWFIDKIEKAPDTKWLAYPEHKPEKNRLYLVKSNQGTMEVGFYHHELGVVSEGIIQSKNIIAFCEIPE